MNELRQIIIESVDKIFSDQIDKNLLDQAEAGQFSTDLWQVICDNGFHQLAMADSGADLADSFAVLRIAGYHAAPVPLAEVLLGNRWLANTDCSVVSIGEWGGDHAFNVTWSEHAEQLLAVDRDNRIVKISKESSEAGSNLAFESRDRINGDVKAVEVDEPGYAMMALSRVCLASGALNRVLELTLQYVGEREQFGRPIAKFQAVQHNLAVAAAEVAAATRASDGAIESIGEDRFELEVAAAKGRVGEAITIVTEIVHQLHGAMGFTHEHQLHHFTRRLWAWREEYGDETYWQAKLGHHIHAVGADKVWDFVATPK